MDPRILKLAENLVSYSLKLQPGEKVLIDTTIGDTRLARALVDASFKIGAVPFVNYVDNVVLRKLLQAPNADMWQTRAKADGALMEMMDAYVAIRGHENATELSDVPGEAIQYYQTEWLKPVHMDIRVKQKKWVVLRWPGPAFAQSAAMSSEAFEDLFFNVCTLDYGKMDMAMDPLVKRMERADQVHIQGPGTDLRFSIKDIPVVKCAGNRNIPDGEVYTAPVKDSVNGTIRYTAKTLYQGTIFEGIQLTFENGKIVDATAGDKTDALNRILDTDDGARFVGEFAIGVNPYLDRPMLDILFDEKIGGSFHFTPGASYDAADNGNKSAVHWDMVCIQTPEFGGGTISFDGETIRKDGLFIVDDLLPLNPENLK